MASNIGAVLDEYGKLTHTRKISPHQWSQYFKKEYKESEQPKASKEDLPEISFKTPSRFKQYLVFLKRDILKKISDTQYMIINFLEAPLLAFLLAFIVKYYSVDVSNKFNYTLSENGNMPVYIFMSVIVAIFMGLSVSAEEIIKDKKILKREKFLNLSRSSYLSAKIINIMLMSALQTFIFIIIANPVLGIKGMLIYYWFTLFSVAVCANLIGLIISSAFNSAVTIYILIPLVMIPMMVLSGAMFSFEKLNRSISSVNKVPLIADLMPTKWSYEALMVKQFKDNRF